MTTKDGTLPHDRFVNYASGDMGLRLHPGDELKQAVFRRAPVPAAESKGSFASQVCLSARTNSPAQIDVSVGAEAMRFDFSVVNKQQICRLIQARTQDQVSELRILAINGTPELTSTTVFEQFQEGGLYTLDGREAQPLSAMRSLNDHFARTWNARNDCH